MLRQATPEAAQAEACFQQAVAMARHQQAKSWELGAGMSLSRLRQQQGKRAEAHELVAPVYGWFTEGFDTADQGAAGGALMIRTSPLTFAPKVGQRPWPPAPRRWWRSRRRCRRFDHNLLLLGPPGAGKAMLARRLTTILPAMTLTEAIETTRIHRVAVLTGDRTAWVTTRPCRAPQHTISDAGLIGGGHVPMLGEVSLAHHGVLCLDAWPECRRPVLEVLRQPLEDGVVTIARALAGIMPIPHRLLRRLCLLTLKSNPKPEKRLHLHSRKTPD
jgi:hypothetical protein